MSLWVSVEAMGLNIVQELVGVVGKQSGRGYEVQFEFCPRTSWCCCQAVRARFLKLSLNIVQERWCRWRYVFASIMGKQTT